MTKSFRTIISIAGIATLLFCVGCMGAVYKNYGQITPDEKVTKAFESYQLKSDFNYFISGSDVYPSALIGLDKTYTLDSDLWKKIEPKPQELKDIIQNMQTKALMIRQHPHGFFILDDKGKQIGVWYSILAARTTVQMKDDRKVLIFTPDLDVYGDLLGR